MKISLMLYGLALMISLVCQEDVVSEVS